MRSGIGEARSARGTESKASSRRARAGRGQRGKPLGGAGAVGLGWGAREVAEVRAGEGSAEWKGDVMGRGQKKKGDQKAAKKGSSGGGGP
ncbi:MAG: hypothetical protein B6A08_13070 [Sorangiineae bacterium NIC37A_2]|nr:MAG: hypothetical protein B6A08_13070 [Sorangiineae bacterium NIC37A_2]